MKICVVDDYVEMSTAANAIMRGVIKANPRAVLGLATGTTPVGLYQEMVRDFQEGLVSYAQVRTVNLDEYVGLPATHPQSYRYFMEKHLFEQIDIRKENTNIMNGAAPNAHAECARYNGLLRLMQRDIQLLGIGSNGHIAFNEPGTPFGSETHVVALSESTIHDNARLFESEAYVPRFAYTMGLKNIMNAKKILILASGDNKANAVYGMVKGEITEAVPASILQLHPDCTLICDEDAASLLG